MKIVRVPGSCGELVQGIDNQQLFLVTCPVDLYATAALTDDKWRNQYKIAKARRLTLDYLGQHPWLNIKVESQLLSGKGMASSSADIVATIELVAWELGKQLSLEEIGKLAAQIEPTDGVFCPGVVKYGYREGVLLESWGNPPSLEVMIFDSGGTVNTLHFNRNPKVISHYQSKEQEIREAQALVKAGILEQNIKKIGSGATLSGYVNQGLLYKPYLEDLILISESYGAVGVNVAHSGTVMGILFPSNLSMEVKRACQEEVLAKCSKLSFVKLAKIISGGVQMEEV